MIRIIHYFLLFSLVASFFALANEEKITYTTKELIEKLDNKIDKNHKQTMDRMNKLEETIENIRDNHLKYLQMALYAIIALLGTIVVAIIGLLGTIVVKYLFFNRSEK